MVALAVAGCRDRAAEATSAPATAAAACPSGTAEADVTLPDKDLPINVFNASGRPGVGAKVYAELDQYPVLSMRAMSETSTVDVPGVALVRYGPKGAGGAWLMRSFFGEIRTELVGDRADNTLDVVVGRQFVALFTTTQINQAIAANGNPPAPPARCVSTDWLTT